MPCLLTRRGAQFATRQQQREKDGSREGIGGWRLGKGRGRGEGDRGGVEEGESWRGEREGVGGGGKGRERGGAKMKAFVIAALWSSGRERRR